MANSNDREWMLGRLQGALRSLASRGPGKLSALPDGVRAEDLPKHFDDACEMLLSEHGPTLSSEQRDTLLDLDDAIVSMSGGTAPAVWTSGSLRKNPAWGDVRERAHRALEAFGWSA